MSTSINTKRVPGRRTLRLESFDEVLAEAERLAKVPVRTLGNWSQGQIYLHLAFSIDAMIDGPPFQVPAPFRWVLRTFFMQRMLTRTLDPGFKLSAKSKNIVPPDGTAVQQGLDELRRAVARIKATDERALHGGFGRITREEWDAFQLRHCELHLSFIIPQE